MTRDLRLPFVLLLLVATAGAFAAAQHLKLEPAPLRAVHVTKLFSPVCECGERLAEIRFRLRSADRVTIVVTDGAGRVVRHLVSRERLGKEPVHFSWDGRDDAGAVVPDGQYRARVNLAGYGRTFELPNRIQVDTTPPQVTIVSAGPRTISPDRDGHADRIRVRYTVDEPSVTRLYVDGKPRVRVRGMPLAQKIDWSGRIGGRVRPGTQRLAVVARDAAGNIGRAGQTIPVRIRFVALRPHAIAVRAGTRFGVRVDADARTVAWRLGNSRGTGAPPQLVLRAPAKRGRYVLRVRVGTHVATATVRVRRR